MKRRILLLACSASLVTACSTGKDTTDPAAKKRAIDAEVDGALADLYAKTPAARPLAAEAKGILVMPKIVSAGFIVGGSYGEGALRKGNTTASYYSVGAGSVGDSARPILPNTDSTSGIVRISRSMLCSTSAASVTDIPGGAEGI